VSKTSIELNHAKADTRRGESEWSEAKLDESCGRLCNPYRLTVTVCHYPPGASKWNPIEHQLFSQISNNRAGKPLESYETIVKYARKTKTSCGLRVSARLLRKKYDKGEKISDTQ
jgi:hypothetical protein